MAFNDLFRAGAFAVITDETDRALLLHETYGDQRWGLPGGSLDPGETFHEALLRECREELGVLVTIEYLSGIYLHRSINSQVAIFRCSLPSGFSISLSSEHSEYRYLDLDDISPAQRVHVRDSLAFDGWVKTAKL